MGVNAVIMLHETSFSQLKIPLFKNHLIKFRRKCCCQAAPAIHQKSSVFINIKPLTVLSVNLLVLLIE